MITQAIVVPHFPVMAIALVALGVAYFLHEAIPCNRSLIIGRYDRDRYGRTLTGLADMFVLSTTMTSIITLAVVQMTPWTIWMFMLHVFLTLLYIAANIARYVCCPLCSIVSA